MQVNRNSSASTQTRGNSSETGINNAHHSTLKKGTIRHTFDQNGALVRAEDYRGELSVPNGMVDLDNLNIRVRNQRYYGAAQAHYFDAVLNASMNVLGATLEKNRQENQPQSPPYLKPAPKENDSSSTRNSGERLNQKESIQMLIDCGATPAEACEEYGLKCSHRLSGEKRLIREVWQVAESADLHSFGPESIVLGISLEVLQQRKTDTGKAILEEMLSIKKEKHPAASHLGEMLLKNKRNIALTFDVALNYNSP